MSVNSTLIAGIGTLLLAMGVGVLIGRSGEKTSAKALPAQVVTVQSGGGAASSGTAPSATAATPGGTNTTPSATSTAKSKSKSKKSAVAPPKVVKVGSAGKGPGYKNGHFTGTFFGE